MTDWYIPPLAKFIPSVRWFSQLDEVWLTFDDGPHEVATPAVLEVLREEDVPAMFFFLGREAERHPDIVRATHAAGHVIGSHGFDHQPVWSMGNVELADNLRRATSALTSAGAPVPKFYRPTYGRFHPGTVRVARASGLDTVLFGVNSWDFKGGSPHEIVERTVPRTKPGDILLFHDNEATASSIASVVREVIRRLRAVQMKFGTPHHL